MEAAGPSTECPQLCPEASPRRGERERRPSSAEPSPSTEYFAMDGASCRTAPAGSSLATEAPPGPLWTAAGEAPGAPVASSASSAPPVASSAGAEVHGRVYDLEHLVAEQQRAVADLSEVVLAMQSQMQGMQDKLLKQEDRIAQLKEDKLQSTTASWQDKVISAMDSEVSRRPALPGTIQEDMQRVEEVQRRFAALGLLGEAREELAKTESEEQRRVKDIVRMASFNRMKTRLGELEATVCITSDIVAKNTTQAAQIQKKLESKESSAEPVAKAAAAPSEDTASAASEPPLSARQPPPRSKSVGERSAEQLRRATIPRSKSVCLQHAATSPNLACSASVLRLLATPSRQASAIASPPPTTRAGSAVVAPSRGLTGSAVFTPVQGLRSPLLPVRVGPAVTADEKLSAPLVAVPSVHPPAGSPMLLGRGAPGGGGSAAVSAATPRLLPPPAEVIKTPYMGGGLATPGCMLAGVQSAESVPMAARRPMTPVAYALTQALGGAWPGALSSSVPVPGGGAPVQLCLQAQGKLNPRDQMGFVRVTPTLSSHPRLEGHAAVVPPFHRS